MSNPLTRRELRDIQNRHLDRPEVMALLREIKRYQQLIIAVQKLFDRWGDTDDETIQKIEWLQHLLEVEPCVVEQEHDSIVKSRDQISQKRNTTRR